MEMVEKGFREVKFTVHAMVKLQVLRKHGFVVSQLLHD